MQAHIYLHPDNFAHNGIDDKVRVNNKFHSLLQDMETIVRDSQYREENKFVVLDGLYSVSILPDKDIFSYAEENLPNDEKTILYDILANTAEGISGDVPTIDELRDRCTFSATETYPTTMMVLNAPLEDAKSTQVYMQFDNYQIVYGKSSWITFRRQILGNHPEDANHFMIECKRYFSDLIFHANCTSSLVDDDYNYLEVCPRKIVYYLSALNDRYFDVYKRYCTREQRAQANVVLEDFSGCYGLEEPGSINRNPHTRDKRTFDFIIDQTTRHTVFCDLHLKISNPDDNYRGREVGQHFNPRIYFNIEPFEDYESASIYVGSIGEHL